VTVSSNPTPEEPATRHAEWQTGTDFLATARNVAAALVVRGEAGIGKTILWAGLVRAATKSGFRVLSARAAAAEAKLTYAVLADLLGEVEKTVIDRLPAVQRLALNRVLLRGEQGPPTDERTAAAAFLSVLNLLAEHEHVLVAIDDLQWLDTASRTVIGFAARRLTRPVGILATARTGDPDCPDASWLQLADHHQLTTLCLAPLSLGAVQAVIKTRLGRTLTRPVLARIHEVSGGNPLYAVELARDLNEQAPLRHLGMPDSLVKLVEQRLGILDEAASALLLAAACAADSTVLMLAQAMKIPVDRVIDLLEQAKTQGVIAIDGNRVRFTHPLLAHGIYRRASAGQRRAMHRNLAALTHMPELQARHLALAAVSADEDTLNVLDTAAETATGRGAPSAAAELLELGIGLGGNDPIRRLRAAEQHFRAGAFGRADQHLQSVLDSVPAGTLRALALLCRGGVYGYGNRFTEAVPVLREGIAEAGDNPALRVAGLLQLALAVGMTGDMTSSVDYARRAVADAEQAGDPVVRSHALALWVHVSFMFGLGTDCTSLQTALALEDPDSTAPATLQPSAVAAINCAWTGDLQQARRKLAALEQRCHERGTEVDVVWAAQFTTMVELWLGNYSEAARIADEAVTHAEQIGGDLPLIDALTSDAAVAAHRGHEDRARRAAHTAIDTAGGNDLGFQVIAPTAALAFLEVSLGNYQTALSVLEPLLSTFDPVHGTEIMVGGFLPDAIEALIALGHLKDAEPLIAALETNGIRLDRPWMRAVGARGRAALHAARGDLDAATNAVQQALRHHERLPMPFERARTQLLAGQLHRRRRHRQAAAATLSEALDTFDALGARLWAARAHSALSHAHTATTDATGLTAAETRIAERAAAGLTNRDIAAELFLSPKTVETTLTRVYTKLGIRSRAALSAALPPAPPEPADRAAPAAKRS